MTNEWGACLPLDRVCIEKIRILSLQNFIIQSEISRKWADVALNKPTWRKLTKNSESGMATLARHA